MSLPTLPKAAIPSKNFMDTNLYSEYQMQAYGQQCREAAFEEAAIESDKEARLFIGSVCWTLFQLGKRIRSMK